MTPRYTVLPPGPASTADGFQPVQFDKRLIPSAVRLAGQIAKWEGRCAHVERIEREYRVLRVYEDTFNIPPVVIAASVNPPAIRPLLRLAGKRGISVTVQRERAYARVTASCEYHGEFDSVIACLSYRELIILWLPDDGMLRGKKAERVVDILLQHEARKYPPSGQSEPTP